MANNARSGMVPELRLPTRAAPRPPSHVAQRNTSWNNSKDPFGDSFNPQFSVQKKKPPPRPPPPKFKPENTQIRKEQKPKKPVRPTELLTFVQRIGRRNASDPVKKKSQVPNVNFSNGRQNGQIPSTVPLNNDTSVCLIDLSPPGSPTFTTRSSSDGVSIDSFGSDGNSNPSAFTSSSSTSQTESGFEDDFDFFGNISSQQIPATQKSTAQNSDPWKMFDNHDPFSPRPMPSKIREVGDASFFAFNSSDPPKKPQVPSVNRTNTVNMPMPTIIRAKPSKAPVKTVQQNGFKPKTLPKAIPSLNPPQVEISDWGNDSFDEPSPPMPSVPPPPPPVEYLADLEDGLTKNLDYPHGIALYDLTASQPGDLDLSEGDLIVLIKVVNDDWMEGRIGYRQGIFPINFIDIKVPLPGTSKNNVNALYTFKGETFEDLCFEEGARITVLSKISDDWLYGEYKGQKGQFPANYVDRIPSGLPDYA